MVSIRRRNSGGVEINNIRDVIDSFSRILSGLSIEVSVILVDTKETF